MRKAYILAITTATILVVMLLQMQNFVARQNSQLDSVSQILVSEKVAHTWSDVRDDIYVATLLMIEKIQNSANFYDSLPSEEIKNFLHMYGLFVETYYKTPDTDIKFLTPDGRALDLGDIPPRILISPFNIAYYYPTWAKNELFITAPPENVSAITNITMSLNLTNAFMDCKPIDPSSSNLCDFVNPYSDCDSKTLHALHLNLSFYDQLGRYFELPEKCFDLDKGSGSTENLNVKNSTSNYLIKVLIGPLPTVMDVQMHNTHLNATTKIILNTTDFYIKYLAQLRVDAVNYNTTRTDGA